VHKASVGKATRGGRKTVSRRTSARGGVVEDVVVPGANPPVDADLRPLHEPLIRAGEVVAELTPAAARRRWEQSAAELPPPASQLSPGDPVITTTFQGF
jgi:nicotinate phosphoribosyltransferase